MVDDVDDLVARTGAGIGPCGRSRPIPGNGRTSFSRCRQVFQAQKSRPWFRPGQSRHSFQTLGRAAASGCAPPCRWCDGSAPRRSAKSRGDSGCWMAAWSMTRLVNRPQQGPVLHQAEHGVLSVFWRPLRGILGLMGELGDECSTGLRADAAEANAVPTRNDTGLPSSLKIALYVFQTILSYCDSKSINVKMFDKRVILQQF